MQASAIVEMPILVVKAAPAKRKRVTLGHLLIASSRLAQSRADAAVSSRRLVRMDSIDKRRRFL